MCDYETVCQDLIMGKWRDESSQQTLNELIADIKTCHALLPILNELKNQQPGMGPRESTIGRTPPESKEPWAAEAATAYFNLYFGSRSCANAMRVEIGLTARAWAINEDGLDQIQSTASLVMPHTLRTASVYVSRWMNAGLRIRDIDLQDSWTPLPREPGHPPTYCPFCSNLSLRINQRRGLIRCFFPGCRDSNGTSTRARIEVSPAHGKGILVFDDGTIISCQLRIEEPECTQIK